jgi:hypothetical protein
LNKEKASPPISIYRVQKIQMNGWVRLLVPRSQNVFLESMRPKTGKTWSCSIRCMLAVRNGNWLWSLEQALPNGQDTHKYLGHYLLGNSEAASFSLYLIPMEKKGYFLFLSPLFSDPRGYSSQRSTRATYFDILKYMSHFKIKILIKFNHVNFVLFFAVK